MSIPLPKRVHPMRLAIAIAVLAIGLAACGVVNTLVNGFKHAKAVEEDLEQATGLKPSACPGEVGSGSPTRTCANMGIYSASRSYRISL
jgi:hypothetical protein